MNLCYDLQQSVHFLVSDDVRKLQVHAKGLIDMSLG